MGGINKEGGERGHVGSKKNLKNLQYCIIFCIEIEQRSRNVSTRGQEWGGKGTYMYRKQETKTHILPSPPYPLTTVAGTSIYPFGGHLC